MALSPGRRIVSRRAVVTITQTKRSRPKVLPVQRRVMTVVLTRLSAMEAVPEWYHAMMQCVVICTLTRKQESAAILAKMIVRYAMASRQEM